MDPHEHQDKDFLSTIFNDSQQNYLPYNQQHNQQPSTSQSMSQLLNMGILNNLMPMQGIEMTPTSPTSPQINAQALIEQKFKLSQLQQLQQLQNQIFQQQIALISSQTPGIMSISGSVEPRREVQNQYNGLPTPGPSTEIHAQQPSAEFVSPIVLSNTYLNPQSQAPSQLSTQEPFRSDIHMRPINSPHTHPINTNFDVAPRGSTSAPEHIAFRNSLPSPADLDFDISPLTSPWLGAQQHLHPAGINPYPPSNKRGASSSGDESNSMPFRKRQSPAIRPTNMSIPGNGSGTNQKKCRVTRSTNSTPLIRSTRSQKGSISGEIHGDSPSPVDLSMPPPAPPVPISSMSSSSSPDRASEQPDSSPHINAHLTPVTPASIMKLGRLGINSGMAPLPRQIVPLKADAKGKAAASTGTSAPTAASKPKVTATKNTRKGCLVSPSLKPILPAGSSPHSISLSTPLLQPTTPVVQVRKTSHKAAEQKRRDSLKTTFDDLRVLLPPIPLPTDEKYPTDEILPGSLPPRGPAKAGGEGPNKGVSKLQLLMCGNEYIRVLKARVDRRDEEIEKLRAALETRMKIGPPLLETEEDVDLRKDLDAVEALGGGILGLGMGGSTVNTILPIAEDGGGGDDDPGED